MQVPALIIFVVFMTHFLEIFYNQM